MRNATGQSRLICLLLGLAVIGLTGCGGGGGDNNGSGSGGSSGSSLTLQVTAFGVRTSQGIDSETPFNTIPTTGFPVPTGGSQTVQANVFATTTNADDQHYVLLSFSTDLDASSVFGTGAGDAGIQVENSNGQVMNFVLDVNGVVRGDNAVIDGVAPRNLRLYYDSGDGVGVGLEDFLPTGQYVVRVISSNLRGSGGERFCVQNAGPQCPFPYNPTLSFSIGADSTQPLMAAINSFEPGHLSTGVDPSAEITINFSEAIDFTSLVGAANVSARDPFISVPFPMAYIDTALPPPAGPGCGVPVAPATQVFAPPPIAGTNIYINYTPTIDTATGQFDIIPAGCGFLIYMPDPILNPAQVKLRPVDIRFLVGTENIAGGVYQNYSRTTDTTTNALRIFSNDPAASGAELVMPPVLGFPGSRDLTTAAGTASLWLTVMTDTFTPPTVNDPSAPPSVQPGSEACYTAAGGVLDRSGNVLSVGANADSNSLFFKYAVGPQPARNPNVPHATFVGSKSTGTKGIACINTAPMTTDAAGPGTNTQLPVTYGTSVTGQMLLMANRLNDPNRLGTPTDMMVGAFIDTTGTNNATNPGLGSVNIPGVPDTQQGTTPTSLLALLGVGAPPQQPWGSYLYVVDSEDDTLKVFNSYDFSLVSTVVGLPAPGGIGVAPDNSVLFVSNRDQATLSVIDMNPISPFFNQQVAITPVGTGPSAVSVSPGNEDVFVANFTENTYSIVDAQSQAERNRFGTGVGPSEVFITNRMIGQGLTNAYLAFVLNFFDNNVTVYESDSPAVPGNGPDGKEVARIEGFQGPLRGCWNWQSYITFTQEPGCYIANTTGSTVDEVGMFNFVLGPPPGFPGQPDRRDFHIRKQYSNATVTAVQGASPSDATVDTASGLYNVNVAGVTNNRAVADPSTGGGVPSVVLVSYPAAGTVVAFNYNGATPIGTLTVPGCDFMQSYYDQ